MGDEVPFPAVDESLNAASDMLEGALKTASPLVIAGVIGSLPATVATLALSYGAGKGAEWQRRQTACQGPAMKNGRCRMHGGLSTGPRTPAGLERSRRARWRHGAYSREVRELLAANRRRWRELWALLGA